MDGSAAREPARAAPFIPLLSYQREDVASDARFRWCCWSRQTGKSFCKSLRRVLRGLARRRNQVLLSAGERQSRELMMKVRQHCQALQIAADSVDGGSFGDFGAKQMEVRLPNGVRVIALPANPQTARGYTGDVLLDEFAMHVDDRAIWASVFPSILRGGGEVDVASTPKGRSNLFYKLGRNDAFERSVVTLPQAVAAGLDVDIEAIRSGINDETLYRQEFLCEFLDETSAFLTHEQIAGCMDAALDKSADFMALAKCKGDLFAGVDIGRRRDLTVIWLLEAVGDTLVTRGVIEMAGVPFADQTAQLDDVLKLRALRRCCIDAGGVGMQLAETAAQRYGEHRVEGLTFTNAIKAQLAGGLRIAAESRRIRVPVDEGIRNDWHAVRRLVTESGHVRYDAQRTAAGHGDRFWAAALAVHAAGCEATRIERLETSPLTFARQGIW